MSSQKRFTHTAIAALAGLAIGAVATDSLAARRVAAPPADNRGSTIKDANGLEVALVLDAEQGAQGNNGFGSASPIAAPNADRFAIRGELSKAASDGACRDVDFFAVSGLTPDTDYQVVQFGPINDKMTVGWFAGDGSQNSASDPGVGKIVVTTDASGDLALACTADSDADFDGNADGGAEAHGLCGEYFLIVEPSAAPVVGDLNGDSIVDVDDVRAMLAVFGNTDSPLADLDLNGIVDSDDVRIIAGLVADKQGRKLASKEAKKADRIAKRTGLTKEEVARQAKVLRETPIPKEPTANAGSRSRR